MSKVRIVNQYVKRLDEIKADKDGRKVIKQPSEFMVLDLFDGKSLRCLDSLSAGSHTLEVDRIKTCRLEYDLEVTKSRIFNLTKYQKPTPPKQPEQTGEEESEADPLGDSEDSSEEEEQEEEKEDLILEGEKEMEEDTPEESEESEEVEDEEESESEPEEEDQTADDESDESDESEESADDGIKRIVACSYCWSKTGESKDGRIRDEAGTCPICGKPRDFLYHKNVEA